MRESAFDFAYSNLTGPLLPDPQPGKLQELVRPKTSPHLCRMLSSIPTRSCVYLVSNLSDFLRNYEGPCYSLSNLFFLVGLNAMTNITHFKLPYYHFSTMVMFLTSLFSLHFVGQYL